MIQRIHSNADGDYVDTSDRTLFHITDVQFSSVALIDDVRDLVERVSYDAYGRGRHRPLGDLDGDGDVDRVSGSPGTGDQALMDAAMTTSNADADFDRDMDVDASDDAARGRARRSRSCPAEAADGGHLAECAGSASRYAVAKRARHFGPWCRALQVWRREPRDCSPWVQRDARGGQVGGGGRGGGWETRRAAGFRYAGVRCRLAPEERDEGHAA